MAAKARHHDHGLSSLTASPRRGSSARTAIGRAQGRNRTLLIATCAALVVAAIGDAATGYDGPGPFVYPAFAVAVALVRWRFTPLFATAMSVFFILGGLNSPAFVDRLTTPGHGLVMTAGWVQMISFVAAAVFATASVVRAPRTTPPSPPHS